MSILVPINEMRHYDRRLMTFCVFVANSVRNSSDIFAGSFLDFRGHFLYSSWHFWFDQTFFRHHLEGKRVQSFSVLILSVLLLFMQPNKIDRNSRVGYDSILASDLKKHLAVLASDSLEGRETAYPGQKKAAQYIASVFKKVGLKPVGDNGSYFQKFDVEEIRASAETRIEVQQKGKSRAYAWGKEFIGADAQDTTVTGDIAFGGFADSPMSSQDKEKLSGKIVVTFPGQRESVNDTSSDQLRRRFFAFRQERGLLAVLVVTDEEGPFSQSEVISRIKSRIGRGRMTLKGATTPRVRLPLIFFVSPDFAQGLLQDRGISLKQLKEKAIKDSVFTPLFLENTTATVYSKSVVDTRQSENVAGFLEGSDAKLKDEILVFTAHYDHLGIGSDGAIYHGADDDGSGTSTVLELAEAFVKNPVKPRRSVLFMTVAGEEKGLLGSRYYVTHPIFPLEKTISNLNTDMIGRTDKKHDDLKEVNYTYVIGSDKISTELDSLLKVANGESENLAFDYTFNDERDPNQFYRRSDHFNFAKNGIPVVFFFTGVHVDYHRPTDTVDKIMFEKMERIARVIYYTGWKVANRDKMFTKNVAPSGYYQ